MLSLSGNKIAAVRLSYCLALASLQGFLETIPRHGLLLHQARRNSDKSTKRPVERSITIPAKGERLEKRHPNRASRNLSEGKVLNCVAPVRVQRQRKNVSTGSVSTLANDCDISLAFFQIDEQGNVQTQNPSIFGTSVTDVRVSVVKTEILWASGIRVARLVMSGFCEDSQLLVRFVLRLNNTRPCRFDPARRQVKLSSEKAMTRSNWTSVLATQAAR